ncbi:uncharacterized protein M6B38_172150 [Iris pallida]|uniref:Uncharacterized protein n=1 Tax=Iris pallida TaxID=29817 RepID=A0AAX6ETD6_IRIPA|nr:uncharacterized protein M6B38_172150 [Iris pallida]
MDPCPFVRVLVGNLSLKLPSSSSCPSPAAAGGGVGVHPSAAPASARSASTTSPTRPPPSPRRRRTLHHRHHPNPNPSRSLPSQPLGPPQALRLLHLLVQVSHQDRHLHRAQGIHLRRQLREAAREGGGARRPRRRGRAPGAAPQRVGDRREEGGRRGQPAPDGAVRAGPEVRVRVRRGARVQPAGVPGAGGTEAAGVHLQVQLPELLLRRPPPQIQISAIGIEHF